ncbi:MAG: tRNA (adenosine(37)-N6)-threonylcarbamoyltransferase complex dimerization subunit type 1 TsaB [Epulopiscium sp. Nele67-Bin004]|nr:MAG: tRNA (adenosine(37)-N6)-threonylcarbamoyltransferase complex dimerization subunit type 1 TsaB [Epulopiscium sp. Nele67-Bin004]
MRILAIDATSMAGSVAVSENNKLIGEYYICNKLTHAETIMPLLEHMQKMIQIYEFDAVAVASGPGSFTGIRIGVGTAKALALALDVPIVGVSTLEVLAYAMIGQEGLICPIMDARRNQAYSALYTFEGDTLVTLEQPKCIDVEDMINIILKYNKKIIFVGDGIDVYKEQILAKLEAVFAPSFLCMPRASVLAHIAYTKVIEGETSDVDSFAPIYLRKPQAQRELEEREQNDDTQGN